MKKVKAEKETPIKKEIKGYQVVAAIAAIGLLAALPNLYFGWFNRWLIIVPVVMYTASVIMGSTLTYFEEIETEASEN